MRTYETDVLIVGAGPVGMALALDLGARGVDFLALEASDGEVFHPKVSTVGPRSMELFRRWGVADRIRAAGWPGDHTLDVAWVTAVGGHEIHRLSFGTADSRPVPPYTPEPEHACPQHWLAPLLARSVGVRGRDPGGRLWLRCRVDGFTHDDEGVTAVATDLADGSRLALRARYLVGCDGASSPVRKACGIEAPGRYATRVFRNILFRAPELLGLLGPRAALVYFLLRPPRLRFPLRAIDGRELYRLTVSAGEGTPAGDAEQMVRTALGLDTPVEILSDNVWHLTHRIARRFRAGRVLLAGDAAHTLSPSGGFGMNTGIVDAADLGWKLAAELAGWAGPRLLDSYEAERRPVAEQSLEEANVHLARTLRRELPQEILDDSAEGERARKELARVLEESGVRSEFDAPDVHLGYRYASSLIAGNGDGGGDGAGGGGGGDWRTAVLPGGRAPHAWLAPGRSTLDLFGRGFHLLAPAGRERTAPLEAAFALRGVPLETTDTSRWAPGSAARALYGDAYCLVRPDGHVAWCGARPPSGAAAAGALVDRVRGAR
ncbi:monooxygenase [Streptomyces mashuensis]|uniref:Monooxygenase n=1 Tax=Streptomyces mashuensis TaxID=33904 RepID=A0A919AWF2_9ACTN|nr:FAD-dependent monooxygenase [Streptomyces mashuensis]GHF26691.1 monooxygenase [Streptomyces mashuensis]